MAPLARGGDNPCGTQFGCAPFETTLAIKQPAYDNAHARPESQMAGGAGTSPRSRVAAFANLVVDRIVTALKKAGDDRFGSGCGHAAPRTIAVIAGNALSLVHFRGPLLKSLVQAGHRVIAIAPPAPEWDGRVTALGAEHEPVVFARASIDPIGDMRARRTLEAVFRRESVDVVLASTIKPVVYGMPAAMRAGASSRVALITGLGYAFGSERLSQRVLGVGARLLYKRALRFATAVRFQNRDDRDVFLRSRLVDPAKVAVVNGSGVDTQHYPYTAPPERRHVRFLLIARLLVDKGIREYVEAARLVQSRRDDCEFHLVGPSDANPMAIDQATLAQWRRDGVVTLHDAAEDVRPHLASCDVYVLPSYREGTPRTVLEAMATGRPVITTDAPGCRETTVHGDNGFLVPVRDPVALADAMHRLAADRSLRREMGRRSRVMAEERYDVHKVNADMMRAMGLVE